MSDEAGWLDKSSQIGLGDNLHDPYILHLLTFSKEGSNRRHTIS